MEIHRIQADLPRVRKWLVRFVSENGDKRITRRALHWLEALSIEQLKQNGNVILGAVDDGKLVGFLAVGNYGRSESFITVAHNARHKGVGKLLVQEAIHQLGKLYARVAADNIPSLKTCFSCGMVGFSCTYGPTGKPTLWLAAGDWRTDDVQ
ncbi:GNAT family N-acetyltransferase [Aneurinibacillus terranovensis]|uniref:GNAT family N-acetyltransferase n=1 Tax=Aneurinibacillus terranovensis TaxID=278991 RepID=UPI000419F0EB|nr:GNAT family N-acetyltransferase [Aneurinibacillus terranovensis]